MQFAGVDIPDVLLQASMNDELVIFAGAGVSRQSPLVMPDFNELVEEVAAKLDPMGAVAARKRAENTVAGEPRYLESPEQFLSRFERSYPGMRAFIADKLDCERKFNDLHRQIVSMFHSGSKTRIVTTNFDLAFERAAEQLGIDLPIYVAPSLPLGDRFNGIVHLHGAVDEADGMVLTSSDYGEAYVSRGWASRFLVDLFKSSVVLFVGYSCSDSLVDYLTRSISSNLNGRAFVLNRCSDDDAVWRERGVEPVAFDNFAVLPQLFKAWSNQIHQRLFDRVGSMRAMAVKSRLSMADIEPFKQVYGSGYDDDRAACMDAFASGSQSVAHLVQLIDAGCAEFLYVDTVDRVDGTLLNWACHKLVIEDGPGLRRALVPVKEKLSKWVFKRIAWSLSTGDVSPGEMDAWYPWFDSISYDWLSECSYDLVRALENISIPASFMEWTHLLLHVVGEYADRSRLSMPIYGPWDRGESWAVDCLCDLMGDMTAEVKEGVCEHCVREIERAYNICSKFGTKEVYDYLSWECESVFPDDRCCNSGVASVLARVLIASRDSVFTDNLVKRLLDSNAGILHRVAFCIMTFDGDPGFGIESVVSHDLLRTKVGHYEPARYLSSEASLLKGERADMLLEYMRGLSADDSMEYTVFAHLNCMIGERDPAAHLEEFIALRDQIRVRHPEWEIETIPRVPTHEVELPTSCDDYFDGLDAPLTVEEMVSFMDRASRDKSRFVARSDVAAAAYSWSAADAMGLLRCLAGRARSPEEEVVAEAMVHRLPLYKDEGIDEDAVSLLEELAADPSLCLVAMHRVAVLNSVGQFVKDIGIGRVKGILKKARRNVGALLRCPSGYEGGDYVTAAINHPVGGYYALAANVLSSCNPEKGRNVLRSDMFWPMRLTELPETQGAKALAALVCKDFRLFLKTDHEFVEEFIVPAFKDTLLIPALNGVVYACTPGLAQDAWQLLKGVLSSCSVNPDVIGEIDKMRFGGGSPLVRIVMWCTLRYESDDCAAGVADSYISRGQATATVLNTCFLYLKGLDAESRREKWNTWIAGEVEKCLADPDGGSACLTEFILNLIKSVPDLRPCVVDLMRRGRTELQKVSAMRYSHLLEDVVDDGQLDEEQKAALVTFALDHMEYMHDFEGARAVVRSIRWNDLPHSVLGELADACSRVNLYDVVEEMRAVGGLS